MVNKSGGRLYSSADVAAERGVRPQTVTRIAAKTGIGQRISGVWAFDSAEKAAILQEIRPVPGNPKFIPGHDLGNGRKKDSRNLPKKAE